MNAKHGAYLCLGLTVAIAVAAVIMFRVNGMEMSSVFSQQPANVGPEKTFTEVAVPLVLIALTFFFLGLAVVLGIYHAAKSHS
jgi:preprotein translocase subunit SecG